MSKVAKGIFWSSIERFSVQGINFILGILLARIVSPDSYGLVVMVQVLITISQVFIDGGFANALIQKQDRTEKDYSTVFIFNMGVAFIIYSLLFFLAPFISSFYSKPELTPITRVLSLSIIISSLSIIQKTRLTISLDFKTQAKAGLLSVVISGALGLYAAYMGYEAWALVIQSLSGSLVLSLCLWGFSWWWPQLTFSYKSFRTLFKFGSKLLVSNLTTTIFVNLYNIIIGKNYSASQLAFYNRAFTFVQYPSTFLESILNRTFYPIECEMQNDRKKLINTFYRFSHFSCFIIIPSMILLIIMSDSVISIILTEKWFPAAKLISILGLNFMWFPLLDQLDMLLVVTGRTDLTMKSTVIRRASSLIILISTISFGLEVICWGLVAGMVMELVVSYYYVSKEIDIRFVDMVSNFYDIFITGVVLSIVLFVIRIIVGTGMYALIISILSYLIILFFSSYFFKSQELAYIKKIINRTL